jgi:hypothetical protein
MSDRFRSEVRILSDAGRSGMGAQRPGVWAPTALPEPPGTREDGPTVIHVDILRSRRLEERLLLRNYDYGCRSWRWGRPVRRQGTLLDYLGAATVDEGLGGLERLMTVRRDLKSGQLTIRAETRSPALSQQVVRAAAEELRGILLELGQAGGRDRARFVLSRLEEVGGQVDRAVRAFEAFQSANRNWPNSPSPNVRFEGGRLREEVELWSRVKSNLTLGHEQALLEARNDVQPLLVLDVGSLPLRKSGPPRAFYTFAAALVAGTASWIHANRSLVSNRLMNKETT